MDNKKERYFFSSLPNHSLYVEQCGKTVYSKGQEVKTSVYRTYAIHFILSGKGSYYVNNTTYYLEAGKGFLIMPDIPVKYKADDNDPWTYIYACFDGFGDDLVVKYSGFDNENLTFSYDSSPEMLNILHSMLRSCKNEKTRGYDVTGYFLIAMSRLISDNFEKHKNYDAQEQLMRKALFFIENNYHNNIRISDIADYVHINRTYMHKLFIKKLNISPARYLLNYRLEKAAIIIKNTDLSFNEIALCTGFYDVSHFYKAFQRKYLMSPGEYKAKNDSK